MSEAIEKFTSGNGEAMVRIISECSFFDDIIMTAAEYEAQQARIKAESEARAAYFADLDEEGFEDEDEAWRAYIHECKIEEAYYRD